VVVRDPSISRQHVRFRRERDEVWVEDLDSRHGTFVRGRRIERERLAPFDEVSLGDVRVVLAGTEDPSPTHVESSDPTLVIQNARMRHVYSQAELAARGRLPILVLGETGTGKEHVAQAIHRASPRRDKPLVAVNCAAIAPSLLESALFGHERGAFTGANQRSIGVFERADGGMLFLDEVGDLSANAQVALLRAIETQTICRLGAAKEIRVDVHIVTATHCDLEGMVEEDTFRRDLYFRLNGIQLELPPLRERTDEIEAMARLFLQRACREWNLPARELATDAIEALLACGWPGNVRQLRYAIERAALLARGRVITANDLPEYVRERAAPTASPVLLAPDLGLRQQLRRYERMLIDEALRRSGGNRQAAAKLLRVPLRTLFRKMRGPGAHEEEVEH
ncbi:MAG TPA: sigma 54-interacting transcriptional regulator, partial [Polyangiales bacterium]|nr:sigma 54-interacting transcriptional regulator [Polyangiales bacterium]